MSSIISLYRLFRIVFINIPKAFLCIIHIVLGLMEFTPLSDLSLSFIFIHP